MACLPDRCVARKRADCRLGSSSRGASSPQCHYTIVKPLHGAEWTLLSNLSSFCLQDYPGSVQFLFGGHDSEDPALQTVEQLRLLHPEAHITVVADARLYAPNRKMSNVLNMLPEARHENASASPFTGCRWRL